MDWRAHLDAVGGTGLVVSSRYGPPSGRNDHGSLPVETQAVHACFDAIAGSYPAARVIVIAPWLMRSEPTDYAATRCLVETQAMDHGWTYVDPLALGWVNSTSAALVAPDGVHPNAAGHAYLASHLVHAMVRGFSMPPPSAPAACTLGA
jgi:hypothetical protein